MSVVQRMFRFSLRNLFLLVTLLGLIFALAISQKPGAEFQRVASVAVSQDGKQVAVSLLQGVTAQSRDESDRFQRTISLMDTTEMDIKSVVHRDTVTRDEIYPNSFFWNSLSRITHPVGHLFYLSGDQTSLICHDLQSGKKKTWAEFGEGYICSFDTSPSGNFIVLHGQKNLPAPKGEQITIDDRTFIIKDDGEITELTEQMFGTIPLAIVSGLGINEPDTITILAVQEEQTDEGEIELEDVPVAAEVFAEEELDVQQYWCLPLAVRSSNDYSHPFNWRVGLVSDPNPDTDYAVATISEATSVIYDPAFLNPPKFTSGNPASFRWKSDILDAATSEGNARIAFLLDDKLVINYATKESWKTRLMIPCQTSSNAAVQLTRDGSLAAVSESTRLLIYDTKETYRRSAGQRQGANFPTWGYTEVTPVLVHAIDTQASGTVMDFLPDNEFIIVGDNQGYVSKYRVDNGELIARVKAPGRSIGLPRPLVVVLIGLWLVVCLCFLARDHLHKQDDELTEEDVEDEENIPSLDDIVESFTNNGPPSCSPSRPIG